MQGLIDDVVLRIVSELTVQEIYYFLRCNKRLWGFWDQQNWWRQRFIQDYGNIAYDGHYRHLYRHYGVYIYEHKSKWWLKIPNIRPKRLTTYQNRPGSGYVYIIDRDDNLHLTHYHTNRLIVGTVPDVRVQFFSRWSDYQLWVIDTSGRLFSVEYQLDLANNRFVFNITPIQTTFPYRAIYINMNESFIVDNQGGLHASADMLRQLRLGQIVDTGPISLRVKCADNSMMSHTAIIDEQGKLYRIADSGYISIQQVDNFTAKQLACARNKIAAIDEKGMCYMIQGDGMEPIFAQPCDRVAISNDMIAIIDQRQVLHIKMEGVTEAVDNFRVHQVALGECGMAFIGTMILDYNNDLL